MICEYLGRMDSRRQAYISMLDIFPVNINLDCALYACTRDTSHLNRRRFMRTVISILMFQPYVLLLIPLGNLKAHS